MEIYLSVSDKTMRCENYELSLLQHMLLLRISLLLPDGLQLSALSTRHERTPQDGSSGQKSWCQGCEGTIFLRICAAMLPPQTHCFDI